MKRSVVRRSEHVLDMGRGESLFARAWLPSEPTRAFLVVHGFAEHCGRYDHFGAWFAARGCAVHAYDQRGHGRSSGSRGHVASFDQLLDDLGSVLARVRETHPDLPLTLVGHSMGGLVVAALLRERAPVLTNAVTSGACLALASTPSRGRLGLLKLLRRVYASLPVPSGIDPHGLSRDPEVVRSYVEDPLVFRHTTASTALELLSAIERTAQGGGDVGVPMLMLHGQEDPVCEARGTRTFHGTLRDPGSRLRIYPKLRHEIFNEPEQEEVFLDLLHWLEGG